MNLVIPFLVFFVMLLASWLTSFLFEDRRLAAILIIGALAVPLPLLVVFFALLGGLYEATFKSYLSENLLYLLLSDFGGIVIGYIAGFYTINKD